MLDATRCREKKMNGALVVFFTVNHDLKCFSFLDWISISTDLNRYIPNPTKVLNNNNNFLKIIMEIIIVWGKESHALFYFLTF